MAALDIMPFVSPLGGTYEVRWGPMNASETFETGEPVFIADAGDVEEPPDDGTEWLVADNDSGQQGGIACFGPGASNLNVETGIAFATNDNIAYWPFNQGTLFITRNVYDNETTAHVPVQTDVGEAWQIVSATVSAVENWGVDNTAGVIGVDVQAIIVDVLDAEKTPIRISGNAGVFVVFEINSTLAAA